MKEKKLIAEEIVKALDICYSAPCCSNECPYFNKHGRNFCIEDKALYKDMKRIVQEHAEQKAKIERLTEENEYLDMVAKQALADYQNAQVQVDELTEKHETNLKTIEELNTRNCALTYNSLERVRKVEKDTAKEICGRVLELIPIWGGYQKFIDDFEGWLKERYGVEVE